MDTITKLTKIVARSHMYWGRKPITDLVRIFEELKPGDIVLDPFCGGGNPTLAALMKGGRVIAGDLNPMAIFLTKVLIKPINISVLRSAFEDVATIIASNILTHYRIKCPDCKKDAIIKYLVWTGKEISDSRPEAAQIECQHCGMLYRKLRESEVRRQLELANITPKHWYPKNRITSTRSASVKHHYELFTGRNLSMLSELFHTINKSSSKNIRDALLYVFSAMLYSCSNMQMFSEKEHSSSRGWTALRFYVPPKRKETNVWHAFETRFKNFEKCKHELELISSLSSVHVTESSRDFMQRNFDVLLRKKDAFELIRQVSYQANFVFLDPPYIDDIDYFGFSEFWGSWFGMRFEFEKEWHPQKTKAELLRKLLLLLRKNTLETSKICLAFAPRDQKGWHEEKCIKDSNYFIKHKGFFSYDNSNKRAEIDNKSNRFTILESSASDRPLISNISSTSDKQLLPYIYLADDLYPREKRSRTEPHRKTTDYGYARKCAAQLAPENLSQYLMDIKDGDIKNAIINKPTNKKTYHSICYSLIRMILLRDQYRINYIDVRQFQNNVFGMAFQDVNCNKPAEVPVGTAFIAQRDNNHLLFYFDDQEEQKASLLKNISNQIYNADNGDFKYIYVMIVRDINRNKMTSKTMKRRRRVSRAEEWKRGFFISFLELGEKAADLDEEEFKRLAVRIPRHDAPKPSLIKTVMAEVKENIPVGEENSLSHFKLRFKTDHSFNIIPGQFIMIATTPQKRSIVTRPRYWDRIRSTFETKPTAYLKRPFGIHRAYYPYFGNDYLKKLSLPPALSAIMHTVYPNKFEIFYKKLPHGVGTNEMTKLKKGDLVQVIGPLGKQINVRDIRGMGYEEIHVIGGGVGMAPLIFMVQALKYYAHSVKAFIGTESIGMLKYARRTARSTDGLDPSFYETSKDATIYINDLFELGIDPNDVYVSTNKKDDIGHMVPVRNQYEGLVTEQYRQFLEKTWSQKKTLAFACGPMGMMKAVAQIALDHKIHLKVLMEKRMACGIGVCLSCVCETKSGEGNYSRVCTDGPVFDAGEILW